MGFPPGETAPGAASPAPIAAETAAAAEPTVAAEPAAAAGPVAPVQSAAAAEPAAVAEQASIRSAVVRRPRASTGDARVDDAIARLDDLAGLPVAEHLAVFEYVHERLTEALGDLDVHAPAHSGDASRGPGG